ncbi:tachylectin-related carbohydrate-binding protein [Lentzea sp. BCCO 10_0061]|uniref:Tachylectin-related carbohydrate-binding protein n=1 Tax=Lentzea sokolovensis TaxID=3095429 RepID=A0ABU4URX0_9PSEU|nr:tachylectin-related carbohydrate-binding protein [Lentzea sp. BCCO 10_0061]MDX8142020.1 tachylectin-related carbohydrate-binding protein [Lentzea sp. BCCO 10_0061]
MNRRLRSLCLAAAAVATTITAVTAGAGTAAAGTLSCKPVANIFTMQADGDLWNYRHAGPSNGAFSWAGARQVGWGWGGKTFAGPNGWLFNITTGGELRRLRYNGTGWDTMPGGGQFQTIGWGWQSYVETANRGRITVDADGSIYTLEGDRLRWWSFVQESGLWAPGSGRVLDVGWSRFDQITASGGGGLQARDGSGVLHRFRYHRDTERFVTHDMGAAGWTNHSRLFSAGGDVYYAVRPDTGQLVWNRYDEQVGSGQWQTGGTVIGSDWGTDVDITATTNDCAVDGLRTPAPALVYSEMRTQAVVLTPASGDLHLLSYGSDQITDTRSVGTGRDTRVVVGNSSGLSAPVFDDEAATATIGTTDRDSGDIKLVTLENGQWQPPLILKGAMETKPAVVHRSDGTLALYALGNRFYGSERRGLVFVREQLPSGDFLAWREFGDVTKSYAGPLEVVSGGDETTILVRAEDGTTEWFRHTPGTLPARKGALTGVGDIFTLTGDGQGGVLLVGFYLVNGKEQVGLRREKADRSGFEETWEAVGGEMPYGAHYARIGAQVLPNGSVAVVALDDDRMVMVTSSKAVGGRDFHPWARVAPNDNQGLGAPGLALTRSGDLAVGAVGGGTYRLWRASVSPDPALPLQFSGGPIG